MWRGVDIATSRGVEVDQGAFSAALVFDRHAAYMIIFETSRLVIRKFRIEDLDDLAILYADQDVRRYIPGGTLNREETWKELDWFLQGGPPEPGLGLWAAISRTSGRFIGRCGLIPWLIEDRPEVEVAYMIAKEFWGQGLGTEAARALVLHGFSTLVLPRLIALIDSNNLASIRTAEKSGFEFERNIAVEGHPARLYAITRPD